MAVSLAVSTQYTNVIDRQPAKYRMTAQAALSHSAAKIATSCSAIHDQPRPRERFMDSVYSLVYPYSLGVAIRHLCTGIFSH